MSHMLCERRGGDESVFRCAEEEARFVMKVNDNVKEQLRVCKKYGVPWVESTPTLKVGIADNVRTGLLPINGLRHPPEGDTTGWHLWAGQELSSAPDFFKPLHVEHIADWCPAILLPYLGLPPGWRFLIAPDHEDVWEDKSLLNVSPD